MQVINIAHNGFIKRVMTSYLSGVSWSVTWEGNSGDPILDLCQSCTTRKDKRESNFNDKCRNV